MPTPLIKSYAEKSGKSEAEVEKLWAKATEISKEDKGKEDYEYANGILKNMLGIKENYFEEFLKSDKKASEFIREAIDPSKKFNMFIFSNKLPKDTSKEERISKVAKEFNVSAKEAEDVLYRDLTSKELAKKEDVQASTSLNVNPSGGGIIPPSKDKEDEYGKQREWAMQEEANPFSRPAEELVRASQNGLVMFQPEVIQGTNCGNCSFFKDNFCNNELMMMAVSGIAECCNLWNNPAAIYETLLNEQFPTIEGEKVDEAKDGDVHPTVDIPYNKNGERVEANESIKKVAYGQNEDMGSGSTPPVKSIDFNNDNETTLKPEETKEDQSYIF